MKTSLTLIAALLVTCLFGQVNQSPLLTSSKTDLFTVQDFRSAPNSFAVAPSQKMSQPVVLRKDTHSPFMSTVDLYEAGILLERAGRQKNGAIITFFLTSCAYGLLAWTDVLPQPANEIVLAGGLVISGIISISGNANMKQAGRMLQL